MNPLPLKGYQCRPATMDDLEASVRMFNACSRQLIGVDEFTVKEYALEWQSPGFNLKTDTRLVLSPSGQIAGCIEVWDLDEPHVVVYCWGRVHPEHTGLGVGSYLLHWAEERARQAISKAPEEARVVLRGHARSINQAAAELFQGAGFKMIRHFWRMVIDLNGSPPAPAWPEGIKIRALVVDRDERPVVHAVRDAFKDHWGFVESPFENEFERWMHFIKHDQDFDPSLWFLAMDGEEIAGMSLCRTKITDDPDMGWVDTLGVRRTWRRRGLGLALLQHTFDEFHRRGRRRVGLGVDAQSLTGATRLYKRAGMHSDPIHQFSLNEKELRPGVDLSRQTHFSASSDLRSSDS